MLRKGMIQYKAGILVVSLVVIASFAFFVHDMFSTSRVGSGAGEVVCVDTDGIDYTTTGSIQAVLNGATVVGEEKDTCLGWPSPENPRLLLEYRCDEPYYDVALCADACVTEGEKGRCASSAAKIEPFSDGVDTCFDFDAGFSNNERVGAFALVEGKPTDDPRYFNWDLCEDTSVLLEVGCDIVDGSVEVVTEAIVCDGACLQDENGGRCIKASCIDTDGDGYGEGCARGLDCNDENASINPGAEEVSDFVDNDCNGLYDEGFDIVINEETRKAYNEYGAIDYGYFNDAITFTQNDAHCFAIRPHTIGYNQECAPLERYRASITHAELGSTELFFIVDGEEDGSCESCEFVNYHANTRTALFDIEPSEQSVVGYEANARGSTKRIMLGFLRGFGRYCFEGQAECISSGDFQCCLSEDHCKGECGCCPYSFSECINGLCVTRCDPHGIQQEECLAYNENEEYSNIDHVWDAESCTCSARCKDTSQCGENCCETWEECNEETNQCDLYCDREEDPECAPCDTEALYDRCQELEANSRRAYFANIFHCSCEKRTCKDGYTSHERSDGSDACCEDSEVFIEPYGCVAPQPGCKTEKGRSMGHKGCVGQEDGVHCPEGCGGNACCECRSPGVCYSGCYGIGCKP